MNRSAAGLSSLSVCTAEGVTRIAHQCDGTRTHTLRFAVPAGLFQLSILADACDFNWDELYTDLHKFNNHGQRTGPWDFSLLEINGKSNTPLVPAYWVKLDGRDLGLWYFQRISLEDLAAKRFRGRLAFHLTDAGEHELQLTPYRDFEIHWQSVRLEPDPEDRLIAWSPVSTPGEHPLTAWRDPSFWAMRRQQLATTHQAYAQPLRDAMAAFMASSRREPDDLPVLLAAYHLDGQADALSIALAIIDDMLALPAWGNPSPEGYGHNGDMHAAQFLRIAAWTHHLLDDSMLTPERRARLHQKLTHQMDRFLEQALLNRDYWGGSLLQDHGWRSMADFATAAVTLLGVLPGAERWVSYALPRVKRAIAAMPRDGAIPPSSYNSLLLYVRELTFLRDALLAAGGGDLYDHGPFDPVLSYMGDLMREGQPIMLLVPDQQGGKVVQSFGLAFFNQMASRRKNGYAAGLSQRVLQVMGMPAEDREKIQHNKSSRQDVLWGFLSYDPTIEPEPVKPPAIALKHFEDSGLVHYHNGEQDITVALRCGPWAGWHANRVAAGPCDRMATMPSAGHFVVYRNTVQLLANADSTYRMDSCVRNVMLVDDQGQIGDIGYPMSIPSFIHPGHEVEWTRWDDASQAGMVRLNLAPAYDRSLGIAAYTRELIFLPTDQRKIICRDHVVLDRSRRITWFFHGRRDWGVKLITPMRCQLGHDPSLFIEPQAHGATLQATIKPTEVVYGYSSPFHAFDHVRYDTQANVAMVDFVIGW